MMLLGQKAVKDEKLENLFGGVFFVCFVLRWIQAYWRTSDSEMRD